MEEACDLVTLSLHAVESEASIGRKPAPRKTEAAVPLNTSSRHHGLQSKAKAGRHISHEEYW